MQLINSGIVSLNFFLFMHQCSLPGPAKENNLKFKWLAGTKTEHQK